MATVIIHKLIMEDNHENLKPLRWAMVFFLTSLASFIADLFLKIDISIYDLLKIIFPSVLVFVGIWMTGYYLTIQIYKNRFLMEAIRAHFLKVNLSSIYNIVYAVLWGCILIGYSKGFISQIVFSVNSFIIVLVIRSSISINKTMMINDCIERYANTIKKKLEESNLEMEVLIDNINNISQAYEECIVRQEHFVCRNISKEIGGIFNSLLLESNKLIIQGKVSQEEVENFTKKIIKLSINQIDLSKNCDSENFIISLIKQCNKSIDICIETNQIHLYKIYIDNINLYLFELQKEKNEYLTDLLFSMYTNVINKLIEGDNKEWIDYLINQTYSLTMSLNYIYEDINIKYYGRFLVLALIKAIEASNQDIYKYLINKFDVFSLTAADMNPKMQNILAEYSYYSFELLKRDDLSKSRNYFEIIKKIQKYVITNDKWLEYIFFFYSQLSNKWPNEFSEIIREQNINVLLDLISTKTETKVSLLIPNFKKIVLDNQYNKESIEKVCEDFKELLNICIINDNTGIFYVFVKELKECIISLESRSREMQQLLFDVFVFLLYRISWLENKMFSEITRDELYECLEELDKDNHISTGFGEYIINSISDVCTNYIITNERFICDMVGLLYDFGGVNKNLKFVIKEEKRLVQLFKTLYTIGLSSIENNIEISLKAVSNSMGWIMIGCFSRGQTIVVNAFIKDAFKIYNIAKYLKVSDKTLTFIITLFTTIGSYCCKDQKYIKFKNQIIEGLKNEEIELIRTAIQLRTARYDYMNEYFDNRFEDCTKEFFASINNEIRIASRI